MTFDKFTDHINVNIIQDLLDLDDTGEFAKDTLIGCVAQQEQELPHLRALANDQDIEGYRKLGHYLKSSGVQVGLQKLGDIALKIQYYEPESTSDIKSEMQQLVNEFSSELKISSRLLVERGYM